MHLLPYKDLHLQGELFGESVDYVIADYTDRLFGYINNTWVHEENCFIDSLSISDEIAILSAWESWGLYEDRLSISQNDLIYAQQINGSINNNILNTAKVFDLVGKADLVLVDVQVIGNAQIRENIEMQFTIQNNGYAPAENIQLDMIMEEYAFLNDVELTEGIVISPNNSLQVSLVLPDYLTQYMAGDMEFTFFLDNTDDYNYIDNWYDKIISVSVSSSGIPAVPFDYIAENFPTQQVDEEGESYLVKGVYVGWIYDTVDSNRSEYVILYRKVGEELWQTFPLGNNSGYFLYDFPEDYVEVEFIPAVVDQYENKYVSNKGSTVVTLTTDPLLQTATVSGSIHEDYHECSSCWVSVAGEVVETNDAGEFIEEYAPNGRIMVGTREEYHKDIRKIITTTPDDIIENVEILATKYIDEEAPEITEIVVSNIDDGMIDNNQSVDITIKGSDNFTVIKEVDVFYYDPSLDIWRYIGTTQDGPYRIDKVLSWFIPLDLVGQGFKLKAVARDYSHNDSLPVEYGPFEILDSTDYEDPIISELYIINDTDYIIDNNAQSRIVIFAEDNGENLSRNGRVL